MKRSLQNRQPTHGCSLWTPSPPPYLQPSPKEGWSYICFPPNSPSFSTESYMSWENQAKLDDWLPYQKDGATLVKNKYLWKEWRGHVWGSPIKVASPLPSSSEPALWSRGPWTCLILPCRGAVPSSRAFCTTFSSLASSGCWWRLWCSSLWPGTWKWWITSALETSRWGISVPLAMGSRRWWWLSLPSYNHKVMGCIIGKWQPSLSLKIINFMCCWSQGCRIQ